MSKQATEQVSFYDDGVLTTTVTDKETAAAIKRYNGIYNQIQSFDVSSRIISDLSGATCEIFEAHSRNLKITCTKKSWPYLTEEIYQCGILNKKKKNEQKKEDAVDIITGGVEVLYYKLLRGRAK